MKKILRPEEENIIKHIRNLFRLEEETKGIFKDLFEDCHKFVEVNNFLSKNYIGYKSNGTRNKKLSVEEYLDKIKPYLQAIVNDIKKSDTWKIQLTIASNLTSSLDNDDERVMHSQMVNDEADEIIAELFDLLKNMYQNNLESIRRREFAFDYAHLLYYKFHKVDFNLVRLNIDSHDGIKSKKARKSPINKMIINGFIML